MYIGCGVFEKQEQQPNKTKLSKKLSINFDLNIQWLVRSHQKDLTTGLKLTLSISFQEFLVLSKLFKLIVDKFLISDSGSLSIN